MQDRMLTAFSSTVKLFELWTRSFFLNRNKLCFCLLDAHLSFIFPHVWCLTLNSSLDY